MITLLWLRRSIVQLSSKDSWDSSLATLFTFVLNLAHMLYAKLQTLSVVEGPYSQFKVTRSFADRFTLLFAPLRPIAT